MATAATVVPSGMVTGPHGFDCDGDGIGCES